MQIKKDLLLPYLIYNKPVKYSEKIVVYPVTMADVISFQMYSPSITLRKNSTFHDKNIIKMSYLDFLLYALGNAELEIQYKIPELSKYYFLAVNLLQLCCKDAEIKISNTTGQITINGEIVTPEIFDDLRRIIIIQNDIDFDVDEFLNYDTEQKLLKAQTSAHKSDLKTSIEDYIDSLVIAMNTTEDRVMNMTIRKFWRYIKRYQLHENYTILKTGECSGMVKFKEPIKHWMVTLETEDRYENYKTNENDLRNKING